VRYQLRNYKVRPGEMNDWLEEWRSLVYPLRLEHGFRLAGAWVNREADRFVWIIGHEDFERADRAYYASPERAAMDPDPARHLQEVDSLLLDPALEES
jgi:NIPSNAP